MGEGGGARFIEINPKAPAIVEGAAAAAAAALSDRARCAGVINCRTRGIEKFPRNARARARRADHKHTHAGDKALLVSPLYYSIYENDLRDDDERAV